MKKRTRTPEDWSEIARNNFLSEQIISTAKQTKNSLIVLDKDSITKHYSLWLVKEINEISTFYKKIL